MSAGKDQNEAIPIVLVTGPSGAGRTTAINALEDFGFETIDNLPLSLLDRILDGPVPSRPIAIGVNTRTRGFSTGAVTEALASIERAPGLRPHLVFVDCAIDVLLQRYSATRRRHPFAPDESPKIGTERELEQLGDIRTAADILIDTTELTPHDLRAELTRWFNPDENADLVLQVVSFSYKRGLPRSADMVMDLRFLRNPHWDPALRERDGRDPAVAAYVKEDPRFAPFLAKLNDITTSLLPAYKSEGKSYFSIGLGCTGGQHRSVFVAEEFAKGLAKNGWRVSIRHRELERKGVVPAADLGQV